MQFGVKPEHPVVEAMRMAWHVRDLEAMIACFDPEASFIAPGTGGWISGIDAVRGYFEGLFHDTRILKVHRISTYCLANLILVMSEVTIEAEELGAGAHLMTLVTEREFGSSGRCCSMRIFYDYSTAISVRSGSPRT